MTQEITWPQEGEHIRRRGGTETGRLEFIGPEDVIDRLVLVVWDRDSIPTQLLLKDVERDGFTEDGESRPLFIYRHPCPFRGSGDLKCVREIGHEHDCQGYVLTADGPELVNWSRLSTDRLVEAERRMAQLSEAVLDAWADVELGNSPTPYAMGMSQAAAVMGLSPNIWAHPQRQPAVDALVAAQKARKSV